jgi:hypothetical protein
MNRKRRLSSQRLGKLTVFLAIYDLGEGDSEDVGDEDRHHRLKNAAVPLSC